MESEAPLFDGVSPSVPADFGDMGGAKVPSFEDYHNEIRLRYVMGLQMIIELQCEALVKEFKVTPLVCGLVGPIWLRFVSRTGVFDDDWADRIIHDSEMQEEGNNSVNFPTIASIYALQYLHHAPFCCMVFLFFLFFWLFYSLRMQFWNAVVDK